MWRIYRYLSGKYYRTTIYMKSGNKIICDCKELKISSENITWVSSPYGRNLMTVTFDEIEAIVAE
jgi:hypothetical protein